jgi:hypothetical protein
MTNAQQAGCTRRLTNVRDPQRKVVGGIPLNFKFPIVESKCYGFVTYKNERSISD